MKNCTKIIFITFFLMFISSFSWAQEEKKLYRANVEFLTGFGVAKLHETERNYSIIPFFVDFDFDARPLTKKIGINPSSLIQFAVEPFLSGVSSPRGNAEVGTNFLIKIGILPETSKIQPYFLGGVGLLYMSQHTHEQGTQFNFNEYGGIGARYFFKKNIALTVEYRYRHLSNAGIDEPNHGIDTQFGTCGISYLFN